MGLFACLLVLCFLASPVVALADNVTPAPTPVGGVTPDKGNLYIYKYIVPDLSTYNNGNGDGTGPNPSPAPPTTSPTPQLVAGVTFNLYKITTPLNANGTGYVYPDGAVTLDDPQSPTQITDKAGTGTIFYLTAATPNASVTTGDGKNGTTLGLAEAPGLPQGIYLVVEQPSDKVAESSAPFVVAVPMTDPTSQTWMTDVYVYPKNEEPLTITKTADGDSYNIGDTITYSIVVKVPSGVADGSKYTITDTLDPVLLNGTVTKVEGCTDESVSAATLWSAPMSPLSEDPVKGYSASTPGINPLTVDFNQAARTELASLGYTYLRITLTATLSNAILTSTGEKSGLPYTVSNDASVDYTDKNDVGHHVETDDPVDVHTAVINITKKDASDGTTLPGAEFKIADTQANADAKLFLRIPKGDPPAKPTAIYYPNSADPVMAAAYNAAEDWVVTTNASGVATFNGLQDYQGTITDDGTGTITKSSPFAYNTYYLVETKAPTVAGTTYNLVPGSIAVQFNDVTSSSASTTGIPAAPTYTATITVTDNKGFSLPKTGGAGTVMFTIGGIVLIGAGAILLMGLSSKKRRGKSAK